MIDPTTSNANMRTPQAAAYLCVSESYLEKARVTGQGPRYAAVGRAVIYRKEWLDEWLDARERRNTSDTRCAA